MLRNQFVANLATACRALQREVCLNCENLFGGEWFLPLAVAQSEYDVIQRSRNISFVHGAHVARHHAEILHAFDLNCSHQAIGHDRNEVFPATIERSDFRRAITDGRKRARNADAIGKVAGSAGRIGSSIVVLCVRDRREQCDKYDG